MKIDWTPVKDHLPTEDGFYLVTIVNKGKRFVKVRQFSVDLYEVDNWEFINLKDKHHPGFYYFDSRYGYGEVMNVIAWAECPDAYDKEEDYAECDT